MKPTPTPGTLKSLYNKGDRRLKRVGAIIRSKKHPEVELPGYALLTELNEEMLSFFSTQKFLVDEGLTVTMNVESDSLEFQLRMSHLHEQISSGRIMTEVPTEANPFPARKFYRCFAKVLEVKRNGVVMSSAPTEVVTVAPAAPVAGEGMSPVMEVTADGIGFQGLASVSDIGQANPPVELPESDLKVA
jgi:hypothetical protein